MNVQIAFLQGVGHSPADSIDMPALRQALADAGLTDLRTYSDSGNVLVVNDQAPEELAGRVAAVIYDSFGRDVHVIVRSHQELTDVVARDPFAGIVTEPARYTIAFLDGEPAAEETEKLPSLATDDERVAVIGREIYVWHAGGPPDHFAPSRLIEGLLAITVPGTARDLQTVTHILAIANELTAAHSSAE